MKKEKTDGLNFEGEENPTKKPYHSPQLTVHGTVEQITRTISSGDFISTPR